MSFDAIVVGAGIIGATHAYYLGELGLHVALVEQNEIGGGTTANNFSWINGTSKTSNEAYHRLNALGVRMHKGLSRETDADLMKPIGSLGMARRSDPVGLKAMRDDAAALDRLGYRCELLTLAEMRRLEPHVQFPDDAEGLWSPTDMVLNASSFANAMAERVRAQGGEVRTNCKALELVADDQGRVAGLRTDTGAIDAPRVIVAAGPNTPEVLGTLTGFDGFSTRFPVNKVPGLLVTTPPVRRDLVQHLNYTDAGGEFHFLPDFNGGLRLASDDTDGQIIEDQTPAHLRHLAIGLLRRMHGFVPEFGGEALIDACQIAVGVRAYPEDGHSIAGAMPGADGLFVIATHSGITLAAALGSLMAELVVTGETPSALAPFGLDRLPGFGP